MGTGSFPGVKRPRRGVDHPPPSRAEVKERVKLYINSPSVSSWPVPLPLYFTYFLFILRQGRYFISDRHSISSHVRYIGKSQLLLRAYWQWAYWWLLSHQSTFVYTLWPTNLFHTIISFHRSPMPLTSYTKCPPKTSIWNPFCFEWCNNRFDTSAIFWSSL